MINCFDILIGLISACKSNNTLKGPSQFDWTMGGARYVLGQTVRQIWNPVHHKCVSKAALELWDKLNVSDSIFDYWSNRYVVYKNTLPIKVKWYNGANSKPYGEDEIYVGDKWGKFHFRSAFHIEHIIPINSILNRLIEINLQNTKEEIYKEISVILNDIYVCYMLKEEDRKLNKVAKINRPNDVNLVINDIYGKAGIEIATWN